MEVRRLLLSPMQVRHLPWLYVSAEERAVSFTLSSSSSSKETSGLL